jgi:chaperonin GroES
MIIPLHDMVLVKMPSFERITAGGIIIPESKAEREEMSQCEAIIVSLGETAFPQLDVIPKKDDRVMINKYAGRVFKENDVEYRLINWEEIKGIITDG